MNGDSQADHSVRTNERIYGALLRAYPRAFRQTYGPDMVQLFGDRMRADRRRRGDRATLDVWLLTLLDLLKSAPMERMPNQMTRNALFAVLFAIALGVAVAALAMGGGVLLLAALGALVLLLVFRKGLFRSGHGDALPLPGKLGRGDWWVVLAGVLGIVEIVAVTGQLIREPKWENVAALGIVGGFGAVAIAGTRVRRRSRAAGDWMMVAGMLPFFPVFWMIWPPIVAIPVIAMALLDSAGLRQDEAASA